MPVSQQQIKGAASERITLENRFAGLGGAD